MLQRLQDFGIREGFFDIKPLRELPKSCCLNAATEVIDYDKTKEILSKITPINQPKSADALKILPHLDRIDFIELKGFESFIHHNKENRDVHKQVDRQIEKFDLSTKIKDSLFILTVP